MDAPVVAWSSVVLPSGLASTTTTTRTVTLATPGDPWSLETQTDTITTNGRTRTVRYDAGTRTVSSTSPLGRTSTSTMDPTGRVVEERTASFAPVSYGHDSKGRLTSVTQGTRQSTLAYSPEGNLASLTDALGRTTSFGYDLAGRVVTQTRPDARQIGFGYDLDGNVSSVTPPERPAHGFGYTVVDLQENYTPPDIGIGPTATAYAYNLDKQLTTITSPDGQTIGA